jgi:hypothetical protein
VGYQYELERIEHTVGSVVIVLLVLGFVTGPLLTLLHELGHARGVIRAGRRPLVIVGREPALIKLRLRRLDLHFDPWGGVRLSDPAWQRPGQIAGSCLYHPTGMTAAQHRSIILGGPWASVLGGLLFAAVALACPPASVAFWIAAVSSLSGFWAGILNLIPIDRGRIHTDGAGLVELRGVEDDHVVSRPSSPPLDDKP